MEHQAQRPSNARTSGAATIKRSNHQAQRPSSAPTIRRSDHQALQRPSGAATIRRSDHRARRPSGAATIKLGSDHQAQRPSGAETIGRLLSLCFPPPSPRSLALKEVDPRVAGSYPHSSRTIMQCMAALALWRARPLGEPSSV